MLEITVTAVEESSVAALVAAGLDLDPSVPGVVPYFLRYTVRNVSDVPVGGVSIASDLRGLQSNGISSSALGSNSIDQCAQGAFAPDAAAGAVAEGCKILLAVDAELVGVEYADESGARLTWED